MYAMSQRAESRSPSPAYRLHGLVVSTPLAVSADPLDAGAPYGPESGVGTVPADVVFERQNPGEEHDGDAVPSGQSRAPAEPPGVIALEHPAGPEQAPVCLYRLENEWLLRFPDFADFRFDLALGHVRYAWKTEQAEQMGPILAEGFVLATVLLLRGHLVLHSSAVTVNDTAIALAGPRGTGKSTVAAILSRAGCRLFADDVLRVDLNSPNSTGAPSSPSGAPVAYRGSATARLREPAWSLGQGHMVAPTQDGRLAVRFASSGEGHGEGNDGAVPLRHVVFPLPDRGNDRVVMRRLQGSEALGALLAAQRVEGWRDPDVRRVFFEGLLELTDTVPVWTARVPWGPPWPAELGAELLEALGVEAPRQR